MAAPVTDRRCLDGHETVVFVHIPKTAGSTLNEIMDANVDAALIAQVNSPVAEQVMALRALAPDRQREIRVVRGHGTMKMHEYWANACVYITLLREPVDRVVSQFHFIQQSRTHPLGARIRDEGITLDDYVARGINLQVDNGQVRALSAMGDGVGEDVGFGKCTPEMLACALHAVDNQFMVVGLQERFEETVARISFVLGWKVPQVGAHKVTKKRPRVEELPQSTREVIEAHNALDLKLYSHAKALFESRMPGDR